MLNPQHPTKGTERQGSEGRGPMFPRKQMMGSACPVHHTPIHTHTPDSLLPQVPDLCLSNILAVIQPPKATQLLLQ